MMSKFCPDTLFYIVQNGEKLTDGLFDTLSPVLSSFPPFRILSYLLRSSVFPSPLTIYPLGLVHRDEIRIEPPRKLRCIN